MRDFSDDLGLTLPEVKRGNSLRLIGSKICNACFLILFMKNSLNVFFPSSSIELIVLTTSLLLMSWVSSTNSSFVSSSKGFPIPEVTSTNLSTCDVM